MTADERKPEPPAYPPSDAKQQEKLKKQVRHIKGNNKNYQDQIQKEIRRIGIEKENLRKDNERLKQDIAMLMAPSLSYREKNPRVASTNRDLEKKKELLSTLERKLDIEKRKSRVREESIFMNQSKIAKSRGDPKAKDSKSAPDWAYGVLGVNTTQESHTKIERQVKVLENRLDRALVKFNEALHINKQLREQIDNLRRERGVFDAIYKKLEKELQERKKEMAFIIEVSNIAYEEKDNAISDLEQLKLYAKKEMEAFAEMFKELDELLEEDRKMKDAIKCRMTERKEKQIAESKGAKDEATIKKRLLQGQKQATLSTSNPQQPAVQSTQPDGHMTLAMYEEAFQKIRHATNCEDISKLVSTFLHSEDDNFSLFNYVNELNSELDKLEEEKLAFLKEIEKVKGNVGSHADLQRQKVLKELGTQLKEAETQNYKYRENLEATQKILDEIMALVEVVFAKMDCPTDKIVGQCGVSDKGAPVGPNASNLLLYLAAIELRCDEFLRAWHKQEATVGTSTIRGPAKPFGQTQIQIEIPSTGDEYNDEDDDDEGTHVMTREELVEKALRRIKVQQAQAEKGKFATKWGKTKAKAK